MKRSRYKIVVIIICLILVGIMGRHFAKRITTPIASIRVDEMTPLALELVYKGNKPQGISSVQSMAATDDYYIIAGRPFGTKKQGGETNNKLIIIDRKELHDVTKDFLSSGATFELGHANGMTYDPINNELIVVGIRNEQDECDGVARIDVESFAERGQWSLPCIGNGIAYNDVDDTFVVRDGKNLSVLDRDFSKVLFEYEVATDLTNQDICYYDGYLYLVNWAYDSQAARSVGIKTNQNVIYQVDMRNNCAVRAFVVCEPRLEMESMIFVDGEAYVLFNGGGSRYWYFYIYRVLFDENDLK
ncbi:hypothetical protein J5500_02505 [Candidatus Saccharibacteria bacterium]|nr:hypothetical protein [Candidatus Saccharibacteria bacterium]